MSNLAPLPTFARADPSTGRPTSADGSTPPSPAAAASGFAAMFGLVDAAPPADPAPSPVLPAAPPQTCSPAPGLVAVPALALTVPGPQSATTASPAPAPTGVRTPKQPAEAEADEPSRPPEASALTIGLPLPTPPAVSAVPPPLPPPPPVLSSASSAPLPAAPAVSTAPPLSAAASTLSAPSPGTSQATTADDTAGPIVAASADPAPAASTQPAATPRPPSPSRPALDTALDIAGAAGTAAADRDDEPSDAGPLAALQPAIASLTASSSAPSALPTLPPPVSPAVAAPASIEPAPMRAGATFPSRTPPGGSLANTARNPAPTSSTASASIKPDTAAAPAPPASEPPLQVSAPMVAAIPAASMHVGDTNAPSPRPASGSDAPPAPAVQLGAAIVEPVRIVLSSPVGPGPSVPHVTTIQMTPSDLGRVEIRIEREGDGQARIALTAERPETLSRLVHDQSQLHQALDQAGVATAGRTFEFSLATPSAGPDGSPASLAGGNTPDGSGTGAGNGNGNGGSPRGHARFAAFAASDAPAAVATLTNRALRSGIDITA